MQELIPKEKEIMDIIWQMAHPCLISDILKTDPALKRNTVAKVLVSLNKKGYIQVDSIKRTSTRTGRAYVPAISKQEYEKQHTLIHTLFQNGTVSSNMLSFLSTMLDANQIDDDFIHEIEALIQDYKNAKE
ncbi:MAG: BlaI/MecI/CopY family transcriptional regulator [Lachnospiraceae bacterium]|nr:BlaI/MecI/CopY family transcriptional regulator [Lachnospiraceae bacterium]